MPSMQQNKLHRGFLQRISNGRRGDNTVQSLQGRTLLQLGCYLDHSYNKSREQQHLGSVTYERHRLPIAILRNLERIELQ